MALLTISVGAQNKQDWARYNTFQEKNEKLEEAPRVVFMGNSITEGWASQRGDFFKDNNFAGRGIGGQTTYEMLARFQSDVVNLKPKYVVILAGTNDMARNSGYISKEHIVENIKSMCQIAKYNKIKPIVLSVLPVYEYPWRKELGVVADQIIELNSMIEEYTKADKVKFIDMHSVLKDERDGLPTSLSPDGVHLKPKAYEIMEEIILKAVK